MSEQTLFTVRWEIETYADSPEEAARQVQADYFKDDHQAKCFDVRPFQEADDSFEMFDLCALDNPEED